MDFSERSESAQTLKVGQGNGNLRLVVGILVHLQQYVQMEHVPLCHVSAMCIMDFQFLEQQPQAAPCAVAARAEGLGGLGWTKPSRRSTPVFCVKYIEIRLGTQPYRNHGTLNRKGSLSPNLARLSSPRSSGLAVTRSPSNCPLCAKRAGPGHGG